MRRCKLTPKELEAHWEAILASEGMAEISLFDNTGKGPARVKGDRSYGITFISMTVAEGNSDWAESVNVKRNGEFLPWCGTDNYDFHHEITIAVSDLPADWPQIDRSVLDLWAQSGNLRASGREFGLSKWQTDSIKRRFDKWRGSKKE